MSRIKRLFILFAASITVVLAAPSVSAQEVERSDLLTPAFEVMAADCKMIKCGLVSGNVGFTRTDFRQGMGLYDFEKITFSRVPEPTEGYLAVGSMTVGEGQTVYGEMLDMLEFVPASADVDIATFCFFGDGGTCGADIECTVRLIDRVNYAPTVAQVHENRLSITALSGKSTSGTLVASDPEGDSVRYEIVKYPSHGAIAELDANSGSYVYVSRDSYTGEDSFSYVAIDEYGNYTESARVSVNVTSDREGLVFSDAQNYSDLSAISVMVGQGIMDADVRGGVYVFSPNIKITRAEFIVMAMKTAGKKPSEDTSVLDGIVDISGLTDEQRRYAATAVSGGYITPDVNSKGERCLRPSDIITKAEAASVISRLCGFEQKTDAISVLADFGRVDASMTKSVSAMYEYGIIDCPSGMISPNEHITREACAKMLYRYMNTGK